LPPLTDALVIEHIFPKITFGPIYDVAPSSHKLCVAYSYGWIPWMACPKRYEISQCVLLPHYCYPRTSNAIFHCNLKFMVWNFVSYMMQTFETLI
jgi:hypothetical protein